MRCKGCQRRKALAKAAAIAAYKKAKSQILGAYKPKTEGK